MTVRSSIVKEFIRYSTADKLIAWNNIFGSLNSLLVNFRKNVINQKIFRLTNISFNFMINCLKLTTLQRKCEVKSKEMKCDDLNTGEVVV